MSGENFFILSVLHSSDVFIMSVCVLHIRLNWIILDNCKNEIKEGNSVLHT